MVALVVGIPTAMLWVALIKQLRWRDGWRGLAVTALVLLAAEAFALPAMNAAAGSAGGAFGGLLAAVGIAVLAPAVIILLTAPGPTRRR